MTDSKKFYARNKTRDVLVIIEFNENNVPSHVRCAEDKRVYEIKSLVQRHGLLTIRDTFSNDLLSVFYNGSHVPD